MVNGADNGAIAELGRPSPPNPLTPTRMDQMSC